MKKEAKWVVHKDTAAFDLALVFAKRRKPSARSRGFWLPTTDDPHFFSDESEAKAFSTRSSGSLVLPIKNVASTEDPRAISFREFLPLNDVPPRQVRSDSEFFSREIEQAIITSPKCWLGESWNWKELERNIHLADGHDQTRLSRLSIGQTLASVVYDMDEQLMKLFPSIAPESKIDFFLSYQVSDHLWGFAEKFGHSELARKLADSPNEAQALTDEVRHWIEMQIMRYVRKIHSDVSDLRTDAEKERAVEAEDNRKLLDAYLVKNPGASKHDVCRAATQHRTNISKWLKAEDHFRRNSTAARQFRSVLEQDLSPERFNPRAFE